MRYCFWGDMHKQNGLQESIFSGHSDGFEVEVTLAITNISPQVYQVTLRSQPVDCVEWDNVNLTLLQHT